MSKVSDLLELPAWSDICTIVYVNIVLINRRIGNSGNSAALDTEWPKSGDLKSISQLKLADSGLTLLMNGL